MNSYRIDQRTPVHTAQAWRVRVSMGYCIFVFYCYFAKLLHLSALSFIISKKEKYGTYPGTISYNQRETSMRKEILTYQSHQWCVYLFIYLLLCFYVPFPFCFALQGICHIFLCEIHSAQMRSSSLPYNICPSLDLSSKWPRLSTNTEQLINIGGCVRLERVF